MSSDDRNPQYEEYDAEFNTMREEMDASGIGASFKPLMAYEDWRRCRPSKRRSIVKNARRDNKLAIDRANKAAAEAAAASEAGSSQAGPSVRDRSNTRSPLAMLTTRCLAQRAGTLAGLARWWGVARATASSLMAAVMQVLPSSSPAHILAKFGAPPDPTKPREVLPHRVQQEGEFVGGEHLRSCVDTVHRADAHRPRSTATCRDAPRRAATRRDAPRCAVVYYKAVLADTVNCARQGAVDRGRWASAL